MVFCASERATSKFKDLGPIDLRQFLYDFDVSIDEKFQIRKRGQDNGQCDPVTLRLHGVGRADSDFDIFEGFFIDSYFTCGRIIYSDGSWYYGECDRDLPHGRGCMTEHDGEIKDGIWKMGQFVSG